MIVVAWTLGAVGFGLIGAAAWKARRWPDPAERRTPYGELSEEQMADFVRRHP
jgi:hypothetical protein